MDNPLSKSHPGGFYLGFNALIDRKAAEQVVMMAIDGTRNGYKTLNFFVSCVGGSLESTHYLCNALDALPVKITMHNIGSIQSAGNLLFMCGDERYAVEGATFFFHQAAYEQPPSRINEPYLRSALKSARDEDTRIIGTIAQKTGTPIQTIRNWLVQEQTLSTAQALEAKLINAVKPLVIPPDAFFHQIVI